jgi:hypothetical protein
MAVPPGAAAERAPEPFHCPVVHVIPSDGERVSVGDPVVPTSSLELSEIDEGDPHSVCAFSALTWR